VQKGMKEGSAMADNPLYVMVYSDREEVHL
jgi:hypothetical protein